MFQVTGEDGSPISEPPPARVGNLTADAKTLSYDDSSGNKACPPSSSSSNSSNGQISHHHAADSVTNFTSIMSLDTSDQNSALHKRTWFDAKGPSPSNTLTSGMDLRSAINGDPPEKSSSADDSDFKSSFDNQLNLRIPDPSSNPDNRVSGDRHGNSSAINNGSTPVAGRKIKAKNTRRRGSLTRSGDIETKVPMCRLSRPGSQAVRVMPPLRGLEKEFKCSWCNSSLFRMANVIRIDLDIMQLLDDFKAADASSKSPTIRPRTADDAIAVNPNKHGKDRRILAKSLKAEAKHILILQSEAKDPQIGTYKTADNGHDFSISNANKIRKNSKPSLQYPSQAQSSMDISPRPSSAGEEYYEQPFVAPKSTKHAGAKSFGFDIPNLGSSSSKSTAGGTSLSMPFGAGFGSESKHAGPADWSDDSKQAMFASNTSSPSSARRQESNSQSGSATKAPMDSTFPPPTGRPRGNSFVGGGEVVRQNSRESQGIGSMSSGSSSPTYGSRYSNSAYSSRPSSATRTLVMDPNTRFNFNIDRNIIDDSPRIQLPPHRLQELGFSAAGDDFDRPQSAEKRRWLARMNLLREGDIKVAKMAEDDDYASQFACTKDDSKYFYIEYLTWMGNEVFHQEKDVGDICCFGCRNIVGSWIWKPSLRILLDGKLEAPLFRVHKNVVNQADVPLDHTPSSTPRIEHTASDASTSSQQS